jgi:hypothetical protein
VVSYKLKCESRSVTTNWVGADPAVLNRAATFPPYFLSVLLDRPRHLT